MLHGDRRLREAPLASLCLHVREERELGVSLGNERPKAQAQALHHAPLVDDLAPQPLDLAHEGLARRRVRHELVGGRGVRSAVRGGELPVQVRHVVAGPDGHVSAGQTLAHELEHALVHHLAHDGEGLARHVGAREHLSHADGVLLWLVGLDLGDGAVLDSARVLHEVRGAHAKLAAQRGLVHGDDSGEVAHAIALLEPPGDVGAYLPDVGDGAVVPDRGTEALAVQHADMALLVLRLDVERHLGEEQVRAHAGGGADPRLAVHLVHEHARQPHAVRVIERKVGRGVDEAFVNGVDVDVFSGNESQVDAVYLRRDLHVALHVGAYGAVVDGLGNLEQSRPAREPLGLDGRRERQADGARAAARVRHDEVRLERVEPKVRALDGGVEALEIDAQVDVPRVRGVARLGCALHGPRLRLQTRVRISRIT